MIYHGIESVKKSPTKQIQVFYFKILMSSHDANHFFISYIIPLMIDGENILCPFDSLTLLRMLPFAMQPGPIRIFPPNILFKGSFEKKLHKTIQNNQLASQKTHSSYKEIKYRTHTAFTIFLGFRHWTNTDLPRKKTVRHAEGGLVLKRVKSWLCEFFRQKCPRAWPIDGVTSPINPIRSYK